MSVPAISRKMVMAAAGTAGVLWLLFLLQRPLLSVFGQRWNLEHLGQWGDTFGALNALFGASGFAAVLYTLWHQGEALEAQRKDILLQRIDQHKQEFDATFFQVLALLRSARDETQYKPSSTLFTGHEAFTRMANKIETHLFQEQPPIIDKEEASQRYRNYIHVNNEQYLGPYFRLMFTIFRRIDNDDVLSTEEKINYGNLVRSQLSVGECKLLLLNGAMSESGELPKYIVKYRILRYLPDGAFRNLAAVIYGEAAISARND